MLLQILKWQKDFIYQQEICILKLARDVPADEGKTVKPNVYKKWNEINPTYLLTYHCLWPSTTNTGTRDALNELKSY